MQRLLIIGNILEDFLQHLEVTTRNLVTHDIFYVGLFK